ncbi:MAG: hypothetical protein V4581_02075 [Bacteroidota bacterium]
MKKIFLLALAAALFVSCSDNDDSTPAENQMTLKKTEKFSPSLSAYTSGQEGSLKHVQYYQDNHIVADSTFNAQGNLYGLVGHTYTANTYTRHYTGLDQVERATQYTFDDEGRLTHERDILNYPDATNLPPSFVYNTNGSISMYYVEPDTGNSSLARTFYTNDDGYITGIIYSSDMSQTFLYDGLKVVQSNVTYGIDNINTTNYTYYNTPVPANMQRSAIEINNSFFMYESNPTDMTNDLAYYSNAYIKTYEGYLTFDSTFNEQNYITYSKITGNMYQLTHDSETLYYYN